MSATGQVIEVTIDPKGQSTVQTRGFIGPSCRQASWFLEQALGERTGEQLTPEFHQQESTPQRLTQRP